VSTTIASDATDDQDGTGPAVAVAAPSVGPLWDVVEEHVDEAEFLFEQWQRALSSPDHTLDQLRLGWEARLLAHIEALIWNGSPAAQRLLVPALADADISTARAAVVALTRLSTPGHDGYAEVWAALVGAAGAARHGLIRALHIASDPAIDDGCRQALDGAGGREPLTALQVLAGRGTDPGGALQVCLKSDDAGILAAALTAARPAQDRRLLQPAIASALRSEVAAVRDAALDTSVVWGLSDAWRLCRELATTGHPEALLYLALGGSGDDRDHDLVVRSIGDPRARAACLWALGFSGRVSAVEDCLPLLGDADDATARLAGEAMAAITGLPWRSQDALLRSPSDPGPEAGDDADDADSDDSALDSGPESALPLFDVTAVARWWQENRARFDPAVRYLNGAPLSPASLRGALRSQSMRRRRGLVIGVAIVTRGRWLPAPARLTTDQQRLDNQLTHILG
jgi:uncharacterized protein (TIGR02270 family)